jgi:hypothetical protein
VTSLGFEKSIPASRTVMWVKPEKTTIALFISTKNWNGKRTKRIHTGADDDG